MRRAVLAASMLTACSIGDLPPPSGPDDGSVAGDGRADAAALQWVDAPPGTGNNLPCKNVVSPAPTLGRHNPGKSCFQSCHNHGFTLAGTMTTTTTSTTPFVGASITVKDANGQTFDMVTQANGNFYTKTAVAFPVTVIASACPSIRPMGSNVTAGGCNKTGCHSLTGGAGHITLP
jgi:hypothetical protein